MAAIEFLALSVVFMVFAWKLIREGMRMPEHRLLSMTLLFVAATLIAGGGLLIALLGIATLLTPTP